MSAAEKPDMLAVLEHYGIDVPERGGWVKIKCPVHDDAHASAGANLDIQQFHCFTCNIKGDVYTLLMAKEGLNYRDAVRFGEKNFNGSLRTVHRNTDAGLLGVPRGKRNTAGSARFFQPWHMQ